MAKQVGRWVEVTPSQFSHESEGLIIVKALLPDQPTGPWWAAHSAPRGYTSSCRKGSRKCWSRPLWEEWTWWPLTKW